MRTWEACVGEGAGAGVSGLHVSVVEEDDQWHPSVREDWRKRQDCLGGQGWEARCGRRRRLERGGVRAGEAGLVGEEAGWVGEELEVSCCEDMVE